MVIMTIMVIMVIIVSTIFRVKSKKYLNGVLAHQGHISKASDSVANITFRAFSIFIIGTYSSLLESNSDFPFFQTFLEPLGAEKHPVLTNNQNENWESALKAGLHIAHQA